MSVTIPAQPVSRDVADESQRIVAQLEATISSGPAEAAPAAESHPA